MADKQEYVGGSDAARIDVDREEDVRRWAQKLAATPEQIREAVAAVGNHADDVEVHLKGSRSSVNSERVTDALATDLGPTRRPAPRD